MILFQLLKIATALATSTNPTVPVGGLTAGDSATSQITGLNPGQLIQNYYNFALMLGGILAFGAIVYGAVRYMIAAGNPSGQSDARDQITQALIGLVLLLGIFTILNIINPELTHLNLPQMPKLHTAKLQSWMDSVYTCSTEDQQKAKCDLSKQNCVISTDDPDKTPKCVEKPVAGNCASGTCGALPTSGPISCTASARVNCGADPKMVDMLAQVASATNGAIQLRITEGHPPVGLHADNRHNNGCAVDAVITNLTGGCAQVKQLEAAVKAAGGSTYNEYYRVCAGQGGNKTGKTTGEHMHINAPSCGR